MPSSNIVLIDVKIEKHYQGEVRTARADIMIAWYLSGHLLGNGDESSDEHVVEGLRDSEVELRLVPNLCPLHAADAASEPSRLHL